MWGKTEMRLGEMGEAGLIQAVFTRLAGGPDVVRGVGEDAAVLDLGGERLVLFTVDTLVEDVHFRRVYTSFCDLGFKALAVNLSDIAAMGGRPTHAVVSLAVPADTTVDDVQALYVGFREAAADYGVSLVGGDTVRHPRGIVVTVAMLGLVERDRVLYRDGAAPGDLFYVTGNLGASAAGLYLFQNPGLNCPVGVARRLKEAHLRPRPRVAAGMALAASGAVTAAEDISDGLAASLTHICTASGVGCRLDAASLPVSPDALELGRLVGKDPLDWVLSGGEDYELLFAVRAQAAGELGSRLAAAGQSLIRIGEALVPGEGLWIEDAESGRRVLAPTGYDAFR